MLVLKATPAMIDEYKITGTYAQTIMFLKPSTVKKLMTNFEKRPVVNCAAGEKLLYRHQQV